MNLKDYQKLCQKTKANFKNKEKEILTYGLGVAGEAGDIAGCIKKTHCHDDDQKKGIRENLGDTMWYVAIIGNFYGWDLEEILEDNINKLKRRYKKGHFTFEQARRKGKRMDWNE